MANKTLFKSTRGRMIPQTDTVNDAGGKAYSLTPEAALARYAMTGCLSNTYYVKAEDHLDRVIALAEECDSNFLAKLAVFARREGHMKDMPALLMAILAVRGERGASALRQAFPRTIDNGRMIRNFVQILRSGKLGRKSLGSRPRGLVRQFLASSNPTWLFRQLAVGKDPSGADIVKMIHPRGRTPEHDALFGYLIGKVKPGSEKWANIPFIVEQFETWKANRSQNPPDVPHELLTAQPLTAEQWVRVFRQGQWHFIRMNLNTAVRQGAFQADPDLAQYVADRLRNREAITRARVLPYQLLAAYKHVTPDIPRVVVDAIHDALEISVENVPEIKGQVLVLVDVSGSMSNSISGTNASGIHQSSKVRCVDVASLFAAAILRKNHEAIILPVDTQVHATFRPEPRDSVLTNANRLAQFGGGGTLLSVGLNHANRHRTRVDHVIIISDQESWADPHHGGTALQTEWEILRNCNPGAKLVCIDIVPGKTHQLLEGLPEVLHVAGWNDSVFRVVAAFLSGTAESWLDIIAKVDFNTN